MVEPQLILFISLIFLYEVASARTPLQGIEKANADSILDIPITERNIRKLITTSNLVNCDFLKEKVRLTPKKKSKKKSKKDISILRLLLLSTNELTFLRACELTSHYLCSIHLLHCNTTLLGVINGTKACCYSP